MAIQANKYLVLPQDVDDQIYFRRVLSKNTAKLIQERDSLADLIDAKYINSKEQNTQSKEAALESCQYIGNAAIFGFCMPDFNLLRDDFKNKTFTELFNTLKNLVYSINDNKEITKYIEGNRSVEETLNERIETAKSEIKRLQAEGKFPSTL